MLQGLAMAQLGSQGRMGLSTRHASAGTSMLSAARPLSLRHALPAKPQGPFVGQQLGSTCRGAGASLQCPASYAAAADQPPPPEPAAASSQQQQPQEQPGRAPLLPPWAANAVRVAGAAAAFVVWYSLSTAMGGPFASLSLAAPANEGLKTAVRSAWAGLAAGCLHTLAGADHLAALTPLTIGRSHLKASLLGALWGFGHSTGQLILGLLMVLLKDRFQQLVPALSKWGGATVGLTLLAIGAMGLYETFFEEHGEGEGHGERDPAAEALTGMEMQGGVLVAKKERGGFGLATFATGIVYGLQPDALFVIVPALALPTKLAAAAYICMFVLGTVTAMGAYTGVIGATSAAIKKSNSGLTQKLSGFASFLALALGATMLLGGFGIELPFALPFGLGGHDH